MVEMTPRERWMALLEGRPTDRVPVDYWATIEVTQRLLRDLGCANEEALWRRLHIDRPASLWPRAKVTRHPDDPEANVWGVRYQQVNYGTGEYGEVAHHPLAKMERVDEIDAFRWPSPDDYDYSTVREQAGKDAGYRLVMGGIYEPFLLYCSMRGMEQAFEDLLLNPEIVDTILGHIFAFYYEYNRRIFEAGEGKIKMFYLAEDLGAQTGPLMGLETYRRFLRPGQKRMADLAHAHGIHVFYHTDGAAKMFLPDLIDYVGVQVLNPIQWRCPTMDRVGLVKEFGGRVAFHGAIDNQQTLPFGTVADVQREVRESVEIFKDARWVCAPCHNLQAVTPTENIVAMYETIWEAGRKG